MKFESMPDEIFLDIFDYIAGYDLIYSFYNLNQRFNSILHGIRFHLDLSRVQQRTFLYICHSILPEFCQQIYSIKLSNKQTINGIDYYLDQSKYLRQDQVQNLILIEPTLEQFTKLISYFSLLKTLTIHTTDYLIIPIEYISQSLRVCQLANCQFDISRTNLTEKIFFLEELNIKISDTNHFFLLLNSMVYLKRLICHISENLSTTTTTTIFTSFESQQKSLVFLNYLKLNICSISFTHIENLLNLCPNLFSFTYTYTTGMNSSFDNEHIDTNRWETLLENQLIHLNKFDLHISLNIDPQRDLNFLTNQFQQLKFFSQNHIRIIYEVTTYKHILCTIPFIKSHLTNYSSKSSLTNIPDAYARIRHFDLVLNESILSQQQHTIRCPLVHSFYLGLYENITPIEQQSRLLLNQSISFVYLKHFELYGTCITDGFVAQLLTKMTNLSSLTLPLNHLQSCQFNESIRMNMKRITKLQLALTESLTIDCIKNVLIPSFPNLHSLCFALDNRLYSFKDILLSMIDTDTTNDYLKHLMFVELFALDQDWDENMLNETKNIIRYRNNYRFLYIWL